MCFGSFVICCCLLLLLLLLFFVVVVVVVVFIFFIIPLDFFSDGFFDFVPFLLSISLYLLGRNTLFFCVLIHANVVASLVGWWNFIVHFNQFYGLVYGELYLLSVGYFLDFLNLL